MEFDDEFSEGVHWDGGVVGFACVEFFVCDNDWSCLCSGKVWFFIDACFGKVEVVLICYKNNQCN